jgi:hypothetical protein
MDVMLLIIHFAATAAMTGLIWFVQVVHYPLFAHVGGAPSAGSDGFAGYHRLHTSLTGRVVGPPMLTEAMSGVMLLWWRPDAVPVSLVLTSLALLAVVWASTIWLQVPRHRSLASARSEIDIRALVATNWIRTAAWTMRSAFVAAMLYVTAVGS